MRPSARRQASSDRPSRIPTRHEFRLGGFRLRRGAGGAGSSSVTFAACRQTVTGRAPPRLVMVVWAPQQLKKVGLQGKRQVRHIVGRQLRHPDHRGRYLWGVVALLVPKMAPSSSRPMPDRPGVANAHCSAWSRALISGGARMRSTPPWWGSWQVGQNSPAGPQQGAAEGAGSGPGVPTRGCRRTAVVRAGRARKRQWCPAVVAAWYGPCALPSAPDVHDPVT